MSKRKKKEKWCKPNLIILTRARPEDGTLVVAPCKVSGNYAGSNVGNTDCVGGARDLCSVGTECLDPLVS